LLFVTILTESGISVCDLTPKDKRMSSLNPTLITFFFYIIAMVFIGLMAHRASPMMIRPRKSSSQSNPALSQELPLGPDRQGAIFVFGGYLHAISGY
jgi:hypothetical protein